MSGLTRSIGIMHQFRFCNAEVVVINWKNPRMTMSCKTGILTSSCRKNGLGTEEHCCFLCCQQGETRSSADVHDVCVSTGRWKDIGLLSSLCEWSASRVLVFGNCDTLERIVRNSIATQHADHSCGCSMQCFGSRREVAPRSCNHS